MPAEVKESKQMDRIEQTVSARFDELTARFESSINGINDLMRTHTADLNAHTDQYNLRFEQIERGFEAIQGALASQNSRLNSLEQQASSLTSFFGGFGATAPNASDGSGTKASTAPGNPVPSSGTSGGTFFSTASPSSGSAPSSGSGTTSATTPGGTASSSQASTGTTNTTGERKVYPDVANASSYVGASLQAGAAMMATPGLARGWTQALAFAPAAVGLVDDVVADVDSKLAFKRAAASAIAGGALLMLAKTIK